MGNETHTKLIVGFALASGAAGLLPAFDRHALCWTRSQMVRLLARRHGVELTVPLANAIVSQEALSWSTFTAELARGFLVPRLKTMLRPLMLAQRAGDVLQSFVVGTYFEHYLCQHHAPSAAIDTEIAARLAVALERGREGAFGTSVGGVFGNAIGQAVELAMSAPKALWRLTTTALAKGEDAAAEVIEDDASGFFARAAGRVEARLAEAGQAAVDGYFTAFDEAWGLATPA